MSKFYVVYELFKPRADYPGLWSELTTLGAWQPLGRCIGRLLGWT